MFYKKFYLKLLMSLLLMALTVPQLHADEVTLFSGTSTNAYAPVHSSYLDGVGSTYQVIYPATELEELVGSNITGVKFYASGNLNFTGGSLKVSVGETTNTSFSSATPITGLDEVATTAVSSTNNEFVLNFDNEYPYNGGNLVIEIKVLSAVTLNGYSAMDWYGVSATGNNVYHADAGYGGSTGTKSWIPMTAFTYEAATSTPYKAKVNPSSLSFGKAMIGSSPSLSVVLSNKGTEALPYSISGLSAPFSTSVTSGTVAVGTDLSIPVVFAPTATENYEGEMVISFPGTDLENITVPVTGAGTNNICDGEDESENLPVWGYWFDQAQFNQMLYPASKLVALSGKKLTKLTFYPKNGINFYSNNNSTVVLKLANVTSGTTFSYPLEPEKTTVKTITMPTSAQSGITEWVFEFDESFDYTGGDLLVEVVTTTGKFGATTFYGENQPEVSSYYKRSGADAIASNFLPKVTFAYEDSETPATPVITVDPATVDAFNTEVGTPVTATVNVTGENLTGDITATVSGTNADCFTAAIENGVLTITYNPTAAGEHTATLTLSSAGAQDVTIALNGTATAPVVPTITVNPTTLNINAVVGEPKTATFTVTGTNLTGDITVTASEGFTVSPATIVAADAANGATVTVSFTATEAGTTPGTITLTSTGAETKTVSVYATATEAGNEIFTVDEESLNFGNVMVGESKTLTVKVTNKTNENIYPVFTFNNNVFSVEDDSYPVYGGLNQTYNIIYTPAAAGTDHGTLTIRVGSQSVTIDLTGNGAELAGYDITSSAASGVHNFGDAFVGGNATWNVTLTNKGAKAVTPTIIGLAAPFSAENVPATIPAGESATITIKFAPTAIQAYGPTSIVVKFNETEDFQFDYTLRGNGIENTGTLPPSAFDNYSYTWTDKNGNEHTSLVSEIATEPEQMIALLREVYTNKNFPGPLYRGYDSNGNPETNYPVPYPAIGTVTRFGAFEDPTKYTYNDTYGWGIPHDETTYPFQLLYHNSSSSNYYKALNGNEFKPNEEGLTLLLVEMKDGANSTTVSRTISSSNTLVNIFDKMFKSVRVITNSKKVTKNGVEGTLFKIDCDKMNRFFFLGKGRLRLLGENAVDNTHLLGRSNFFIDKSNQTSSTLSIQNVANDEAPFFEMFEQFSPVSLIEGTESNDVYQELINMQSYPVEHDCVYIPWAPAQVSGGEAGHEFNMYGKSSISDDCQDVRDLMFFVPDQRMKAWASRDRGANDKFVNYYEDGGYAPTMGMYVIVQNDITGEKIDGQDTYKLHLTWDSNLTDFVPADKGLYYIYQVNEDGSYTKVGETDSQTKELYLDVNMAEHGQQVTYVIQGLDNTGFLSLQFSNEESFIIPGTNPFEKFQLDPKAEIYSRYNPADEHNYYANGLQVKGYADATADMFVGKTINFFRKPVTGTTEGEWLKIFAVNATSATAATISESNDQRAQQDYIYGYKQNPSAITISTDKVFDVIYDNFKADVKANNHADLYRYMMVVDGTPADAEKYHSNQILVKVYKTEMSNIAGSFDQNTVDNDTQHLVGLQTTEFDIDVEHSSKTEILRYGAYRWTQDENRKILNGTADAEEDISPNGQASNQGEYYSVYMNGDTFIGEDVYVSQGQKAQATFEDNYPEEHPNAYVYAPVIETFTGRADYNTYGAPLQNTATGTIELIPGSVIGSSYDFTPQSTTGTSARCRYYLIPMTVNVDIPTGYEIYKVRAWRQVDTQWLGEEVEAYFDRISPDYLFETLDEANKETGVVIGSFDPNVPGSADVNVQFGAKKLADNETFDVNFIVRVYFTKAASRQVTSADGKYYIMESKQKVTIDNKIITGVTNVNSDKQVAGVKYYNLMGVESNEPFNGVNIVVTRYTDGSISTQKVLK